MYCICTYEEVPREALLHLRLAPELLVGLRLQATGGAAIITSLSFSLFLSLSIYIYM